jgi:hypothetical protein
LPVLPDFHDGYFDGIWLAANNRAHLFLRTVNGESFVMALDGVKAIVLNELKEGNIIFDLVFRNTENIVYADMEALYGVGSDKQPLVRALEAATAERLQILELNSSYGAHGLALFQTWTVSQREVQP